MKNEVGPSEKNVSYMRISWDTHCIKGDSFVIMYISWKWNLTIQ